MCRKVGDYIPQLGMAVPLEWQEEEMRKASATATCKLILTLNGHCVKSAGVGFFRLRLLYHIDICIYSIIIPLVDKKKDFSCTYYGVIDNSIIN